MLIYKGVLYVNKTDMLSLIDHLITQARFWHLEYAKANIIPSEYEKIKSYRQKFDEDLYRKGEDIINHIESQSDVESITILLKGYSILLSSNLEQESAHHCTSHQLRQILESLKAKQSVDEQNSTNKLYIEESEIIGYTVTYKSDYQSEFHKNK